MDTADDFRQAQGSQALQQAGMASNHSPLYSNSTMHSMRHLQVIQRRFQPGSARSLSGLVVLQRPADSINTQGVTRLTMLSWLQHATGVAEKV